MFKCWKKGLLLYLTVFLLVGCASNTHVDVEKESDNLPDINVDTTNETTETANDMIETKTNDEILISNLGITPYSYDSEFTLSEEMRSTIEQIVLNDRQYRADRASTEEWKNDFIALFLQNSRYGCEYINSICEENNALLSLEQVEYINYSITGEYVDFSDVVKEGVDCSKCSSFWNSALIDEYQITEEGDTIIIDAHIGIYTDGDDVPCEQYNSQITLVKNEYSFLDGYSIEEIIDE